MLLSERRLARPKARREQEMFSTCRTAPQGRSAPPSAALAL